MFRRNCQFKFTDSWFFSCFQIHGSCDHIRSMHHIQCIINIDTKTVSFIFLGSIQLIKCTFQIQLNTFHSCNRRRNRLHPPILLSGIQTCRCCDIDTIDLFTIFQTDNPTFLDTSRNFCLNRTRIILITIRHIHIYRYIIFEPASPDAQIRKRFPHKIRNTKLKIGIFHRIVQLDRQRKSVPRLSIRSKFKCDGFFRVQRDRRIRNRIDFRFFPVLTHQ